MDDAAAFLAPQPAPNSNPEPAPAPWRDDAPGRAPSAPAAVWAAVREDYLAGVSAPEACRRHGVGLTALRARAGREGWRRADQPWVAPNRLDPDDEGVALEAEVGGELDRVDLSDLSWIAFRRMMRAALRGDAVEALRWRRVRQAMDAEAEEVERLGEQLEALPPYRPWPDPARATDAVDATDATDATDADGVFPPTG